MAIGGQRVVLRLRVRRLFCDNSGCAAKTFTEQVADLTEPYARRTTALRRVLEVIAVALAGRANRGGDRARSRRFRGQTGAGLRAAWLKAHPEVRITTRDRARAYAEAASPASADAGPTQDPRVSGWIMRNPDNLDDHDEQRLKAILARCPELEATRRHVGSFGHMIRIRHEPSQLRHSPQTDPAPSVINITCLDHPKSAPEPDLGTTWV